MEFVFIETRLFITDKTLYIMVKNTRHLPLRQRLVFTFLGNSAGGGSAFPERPPMENRTPPFRPHHRNKGGVNGNPHGVGNVSRVAHFFAQINQ